MTTPPIPDHTPSASLPLAGRRILITRAPHQASELADRLRALGATPILVPTIEIGPPASFAALDAALASLSSFDLIAFTSANAVEAFHQRAQHLDLASAPKRIAAVGPATARALQSIGLRADVLPPTFTAESLAETLLPEAPGRRILLLVPESALAESEPEAESHDHRAPQMGAPGQASLTWEVNPGTAHIDSQTQSEPAPATLRTTLAAAGAHVTVAAAYANRIPAASLAAIASLFADPANYPDAITFTSASTARNLMTLLQTANLSLSPDITLASIGPITSQTLRDLNHEPTIEASEPTIPALVQSLLTHFNQR